MKFTNLALCCALATGAVHAEVVVIAHPDTPVKQIDSGQAAQIFLKQAQTWPDGRPIAPVDIKDGSPLRSEFYTRIVGRNPGQMRAYWARQMFTGMGVPPKEVADAADVVKLVGRTPGTVGYVGANSVDPSVKVILDPAK